VPTVGMCMGDIGTPSRILTTKFGSPFTYATFHHERVLAPGQLSFEQMVHVYRHNEIGRDTAARLPDELRSIDHGELLYDDVGLPR